jgi:FMN reductase
MNPKILGLGGSFREGSRTLKALEMALQGAAKVGVETELLDLKELSLPLYDDRKEIESYPKSVFTLLDRVRASDGLILASPVYHGTLSGSIKNALDFLELLNKDEPPWLESKIVGLISVAGGGPGINAINSMLYACRALHAWVLPTAVAVPGSAFGSNGQLHDPKLRDRLLKLGREVTQYAALFAVDNAKVREEVS